MDTADVIFSSSQQICGVERPGLPLSQLNPSGDLLVTMLDIAAVAALLAHCCAARRPADTLTEDCVKAARLDSSVVLAGGLHMEADSPAMRAKQIVHRAVKDAAASSKVGIFDPSQAHDVNQVASAWTRPEQHAFGCQMQCHSHMDGYLLIVW